MVRGSPWRVHQDDGQAELGRGLQARGSCVSAETSLMIRRPPPPPARITSALRVSIESGRGTRGERRDDRQHAAAFLLEVDGAGAGPRRFPADVEDVGALGLEPQGMRDRGVGGGVAAAVGETVGRDVDDAHDARPVERDAGDRRARRNHASSSAFTPPAAPPSSSGPLRSRA